MIQLRRARKRRDSKVHIAVDTLGHWLALKVTAANQHEGAQVAELAQALQAANAQNKQLCNDRDLVIASGKLHSILVPPADRDGIALPN